MPKATAARAKLHEQTRKSNPAKQLWVRKKISAAVKANHPSKEYPEQWAAHARAIKPRKVSKLEDAYAWLFPEFERQYRIGFYTVDFCHPASKHIIEIQGCYWHSCQTCFPGSPKTAAQKVNARVDKARRTYLTKRGWHIEEIWEHDYHGHNLHKDH